MKKVYHLLCNKEYFLESIYKEVKVFNSIHYFPIKIIQKNQTVLLSTRSVLSRQLYSIFQLEYNEKASSIIIEAKLKMSILAKVFFLATIILMINKLVIDLTFQASEVFLLILIIFYLKYYIERSVFKKFVISILDKFEQKTSRLK